MEKAKKEIEDLRAKAEDLHKKLEDAESRAAAAMANPGHRNSILKRQPTSN